MNRHHDHQPACLKGARGGSQARTPTSRRAHLDHAKPSCSSSSARASPTACGLRWREEFMPTKIYVVLVSRLTVAGCNKSICSLAQTHGHWMSQPAPRGGKMLRIARLATTCLTSASVVALAVVITNTHVVAGENEGVLHTHYDGVANDLLTAG